MNRAFKYSTAFILLIAVLILLPFSAMAESMTADNGYTYNYDNSIVPDRKIYTVLDSASGKQSGTDNYSSPEDIFVYKDNIFIADTGNSRIVVLDENFKFIREIYSLSKNGEPDNLITPTGIFVSSAGILVCDRDGERAVLINENNEVISEFLKPRSESLKGTAFRPSKCAMDTYGNVYILASGVYQGILQYTEDGEFLNFYGSNVIENTAALKISRFWKNFFNKSASETMARDIPMEYNNMFMDADGFIYTTVYKTETGSNNLKKLNSRGKNIMFHIQDQSKLDRNRYGDQHNLVKKGEVWDTTLVDVTVDENGIISVLDNTWCRIFQYNQDGDIIGEFGGRGEIKGQFKGPAAIENMGDRILVLDKLNGTVTSFIPTDYRNTLGQALRYYSEGEYQESIELWKQVIKQNSNIPLAYKSIGKAYMQQNRLDEALENFKIAGDRESYSLVYGRLRQKFIKDNIFTIVLSIAAVVFIFRYLRRIIHKWIWNSYESERGNNNE